MASENSFRSPLCLLIRSHHSLNISLPSDTQTFYLFIHLTAVLILLTNITSIQLKNLIKDRIVLILKVTSPQNIINYKGKNINFTMEKSS